MPRVWIVNESGHPYSAAERYGDLFPLTSGSINIFRLDRVALHLATGLSTSTPDDFLLISGSPILNMVALQIWLCMHPTCHLLQWHAVRADYVLTSLTRETIQNVTTKALGLE